ncbi:MAG: flagellar export chaperone FliS [Candidatus Lindowbacteria bacterium RIFCSPLOWO2_12_FULL_62_27]|nr:MAG: flagellar export chaperone FliS [Candidatus Lindowbacteria bacterium RIFCSPLOWO2_02_FULL_62_12]OGH63262.1 MAG: flagellar export chaperone FliS [Candidatus Lindowbacteria bacterium RIFCSPLOWO2_12_FULL_62_27]
MKNPIREYREVQIQTASQEQLILMMYAHAIKSIQTAREAMPGKKYDVVSNHIIKAQDIVTELMVSLKMEAGPIAQNLYRIYDYVNRRLIEANMKKNPQILDEIEKMLSTLHQTWEEMFKKLGPARDVSAEPGQAQPPGPTDAGGFSVSG